MLWKVLSIIGFNGISVQPVQANAALFSLSCDTYQGIVEHTASSQVQDAWIHHCFTQLHPSQDDSDRIFRVIIPKGAVVAHIPAAAGPIEREASTNAAQIRTTSTRKRTEGAYAQAVQESANSIGELHAAVPCVENLNNGG